MEALKFYADAKNHSMAWRPDAEIYVPANSDGTSVIEVDAGKKAKEALAKVRGEK